MRVKDCIGCRYCKRYVWSQPYKPSGYHAIGMSHAYHKCEAYGKRCTEVKFCAMEDFNTDADYAYMEHTDCYG